MIVEILGTNKARIVAKIQSTTPINTKNTFPFNYYLSILNIQAIWDLILNRIAGNDATTTNMYKILIIDTKMSDGEKFSNTLSYWYALFYIFPLNINGTITAVSTYKILHTTTVISELFFIILCLKFSSTLSSSKYGGMKAWRPYNIK